MDAVTRAASTPANTYPYLPEESRLEMPEQSLRDAGAGFSSLPSAPASIPMRRAFVFGVAITLSLYAAYEMYNVLAVGGLTTLETIVLVLFVILFAWIAFSFASTLGGVVAMVTGRTRILEIETGTPLPALSAQTALLLPTYNEDPDRVLSRVQAVYESVVATGTIAHFDVFILSDTTDPDVFIAEEAAFLALRARLGNPRIFYRHRPKNEARKAGNIADWVRRFGGHYAQMVILDADSLMTGDTLVRLAAAMERDPGVGLIQTFPVMVNGTTPFARLQQFAGRLYGPLIAHGLAWWHGADGNYWGHNAVIRTKAFAQCGGLPVLKGPRPVGGHILSHDFVEAALMRRGGWAIHMAPTLPGSYEESPPSITEYAARDRRWCQGNLQHIGVLPARGLHWVSRLHFITGIGSYIAAPLWLLFLFVGILIALQAQFIRPEYFPKTFTLYPQWPAQDPVRAAYVFAGSMGLLLAPKLVGYLAMLSNGAMRRAFGGGVRTFFSVLAEIVISALIAPIMMLIQSASVVSILSGRDSGWNAQRRDDGTLPWRDLVKRYGRYTLFGCLMAFAAYEVSFALFAWMTPVIVGLVLAIPLAHWTASPGAGRMLRRLGLLNTPEETHPPEILTRANALAAEAAPHEARGLARLLADAELLEAHRAMLPAPTARKVGHVDVALVVGLAKLEDCTSLREANAALTRQELMALLADARGVDRLAGLSQAA